MEADDGLVNAQQDLDVSLVDASQALCDVAVSLTSNMAEGVPMWTEAPLPMPAGPPDADQAEAAAFTGALAPGPPATAAEPASSPAPAQAPMPEVAHLLKREHLHDHA